MAWYCCSSVRSWPLVLLFSIATGTRFRFEGPSWLGTALVILFIAGTIYGFLIRPGRRWSWPWSKDKNRISRIVLDTGIHGARASEFRCAYVRTSASPVPGLTRFGLPLYTSTPPRCGAPLGYSHFDRAQGP